MLVVVFNASAGTSPDVTEEIAREPRQRCSDKGEVPQSLEAFLVHQGAINS